MLPSLISGIIASASDAAASKANLGEALELEL